MRLVLALQRVGLVDLDRVQELAVRVKELAMHLHHLVEELAVLGLHEFVVPIAMGDPSMPTSVAVPPSVAATRMATYVGLRYVAGAHVPRSRSVGKPVEASWTTRCLVRRTRSQIHFALCYDMGSMPVG